LAGRGDAWAAKCAVRLFVSNRLPGGGTDPGRSGAGSSRTSSISIATRLPRAKAPQTT
jgi:hypothetical protein